VTIVWRRVLDEHRRFVLGLAAALAANVAVYAGLVYPLSARVADADTHASRASRALGEAQREFEAAKGVAASKDRAEAELRSFYGEVLPPNLSAARRATYLNLAQLARQTNLRVVRFAADEGRERGSTLDRLLITLVLEGQYEDARAFVHQLETAPEFVVIDHVAIDQARDGGANLMLRLQLSTYYRAADNAG
jgi:nitrate reductase assembly molybdenum cofactor insertion protein NarJ